jgi:hypothetical protein
LAHPQIQHSQQQPRRESAIVNLMSRWVVEGSKKIDDGQWPCVYCQRKNDAMNDEIWN